MMALVEGLAAGFVFGLFICFPYFPGCSCAKW